MVIRQSLWGGDPLSQLLHREGPPRLSRPAVLALGGALALHLLAAGYIYTQRFRIAPPAPVAEGPVVTVRTWIPITPKVEPAPAPAASAPQRQVAVRPSLAPPQQPVDVIQTPPSDPVVSTTPPTTLRPAEPLPPVETVTPPPPQPPAVISNPKWLSRPSPDQMAAAYPDRALRLERSGQAALLCTVVASGSVTGCTGGVGVAGWLRLRRRGDEAVSPLPHEPAHPGRPPRRRRPGPHPHPVQPRRLNEPVRPAELQRIHSTAAPRSR